MTTHSIGKLKFRFSRHGLMYHWGNGKIRTLGFKKVDAGEAVGEYPEDGEFPYDGDGYYDDRADDSDYREDDYDDRAGGYEDADGYDAGDEGGYAPDDEPRGVAGAALEYIENNAWALIALLVVLPPLGIYLLWRLNRYEPKVRIGISAAAAVWFIVLLILLFSNVFDSGKDQTTLPQMNLTTVAPTTVSTTTPTAAPTNELGVDANASPEASPGATPLAGDTTDGTLTVDSSTSLVYSPQSGLYYHADDNCEYIPAGSTLTKMTVAAAQNRNQTACPLCVGDLAIYYARDDSRWYHTDKTCQGMTGAEEITKAAAEARGQTACPVCAGGTSEDEGEDDDTTQQSSSQKYLESIRNDKSGMDVYMTSNGKHYHTNATCSGMSGAKKVTLLKALQAGKTGCPICSPGGNKKVYCTESGKSYHTVSDCSGMQNAKSVTLSLALVLGKKRCTVCVSDDFYTSTDTGEGESGTVYVYATRDGKYYHTNSTCSGMTDADRVPLLTMLNAGRQACPTCASSAAKTVYVSQGGRFYHSYATCSGMTDAKSGTLAQALAYGYTACTKCWGSGESGDSTDTNGEDGNSGYSGVYVYATEEGKYYHTRSSCSKAEDGVTKVLLEQAIDDGKEPCSTCASTANNTVYALKGGRYYHKVSSCSGATNMQSGTLAKALAAGFTQCPICFSASDEGTGTGTDGAKYESGTSGISVYATPSGRYYHTKSGCSNISGSATKVSLETALNYGKSACPVCASSADRSVYATKGGKYFHYSSSCAGSSATKGPLDSALAYGFEPCPNCVTGNEGSETPSDRFDSGTSGIKVYATSSGKYFHTKSNCGGMSGAEYVTLETALNYGKTACPDCAAAAGKKVYSVSGSGTYHYDAAHAGSGATPGTLAEALAYGLDPCKVCVTGEQSGGGNTGGGDEGGEESSAPANTTVYIDYSGDSSMYLYHTSSKCKDAGMTGGTSVTLEFALNHGYSDCGYCNPPTSISQ